MKSRVPNADSAMGAIAARKRRDGSVAFMAHVRVMRDGFTYHETETFDRRPAATSWIRKRVREPAKAINGYTEESLKEIGRMKTQVLRAIENHPIADMPCSAIKSKDVIDFLQSLTSQPQVAI